MKLRQRLIIGTACAAAAALGAAPAFASSHREAPNITKMPKVDNTDTYAFTSYEPGRQDYVTLLANFQPGENPGDGPNYYTMDPDAIYEVHVDNVGDAAEHLTFQFKFTNTLVNDKGATVNVGGKDLSIALRHAGPIANPSDPNVGENESYTVTMITGDRRTGTRAAVTNAAGGAFLKPFDNAGNKSIPDYTAYSNKFIYSATIPGCATPGKVFVGSRAEAFAINLGPVFDLVNFVPVEGDNDPVYGNGTPFPGGITQSAANQELIGKKNVTTIALEVPKACLVGTGNGVIGVWSTASLPQARLLRTAPTFNQPMVQGGAYVQVSRLGSPLVNELVIGIKDKDLFNASVPKNDAQFLDYVTNPTFPALLDALFRAPVRGVVGGSGSIAPTNFPRNDLVTTFLTGFKGVNQLATVTPSEMIRLNTKIAPTPQAAQSTFGVVGNDLAGYPNGRRPGDDVTDITLRVAMGRLCYPIPVAGVQTALGLCQPTDAPTGMAAFTDGA
ncbi:MAG: DUF4331 domain-containing protein, partial [Janthinobacterium lividum]